MLKNLNIYQKIGQLIMPRLDFNSPESIEEAKELVEKFCVGGFIVFGGERGQVKEVIEELKRISRFPLFFGCDAERGIGQIVSGTTRFPFAMALGAIRDEGLIYRQARWIAREAKECGINLIFAPIVDVNTNRENPIINIRSYSDDPSLVSRLGGEFIKGCQESGVMACAKHFPGHGATKADSHVSLPVVLKNQEELGKCELPPFIEAIRSDVASIMIGHIAVLSIDPTRRPGTISSPIVRELLIRDLGFTGLVVTDALNMEALAGFGSGEEVVCQSILAGCDLMLHPREPMKLIERLYEMVKKGEISEAVLDSALGKILATKRKWLTSKVVEIGLDVDEYYGENLVDEIALRSVCCLKGGRLSSQKATLCVLDVTQSGVDISRPFLKRLTEAGIGCEKKLISQEGEDAFPLRIKNNKQAVICLVYTSVEAWKKHTKISESFHNFLRSLENLSCEKVLVSFGSPYVVEGFNNFNTILCTFDLIDTCQVAIADALSGRLEARGCLPVKLRPHV